MKFAKTFYLRKPKNGGFYSNEWILYAQKEFKRVNCKWPWTGKWLTLHIQWILHAVPKCMVTMVDRCCKKVPAALWFHLSLYYYYYQFAWFICFSCFGVVTFCLVRHFMSVWMSSIGRLKYAYVYLVEAVMCASLLFSRTSCVCLLVCVCDISPLTHKIQLISYLCLHPEQCYAKNLCWFSDFWRYPHHLLISPRPSLMK